MLEIKVGSKGETDIKGNGTSKQIITDSVIAVITMAKGRKDK